MKKFFLTSFLALLSLCTYAYDFKAGGIYYNRTGDNTVEVINNANGKYAGNIVIPNKVIDGFKTYSVTSIGNDAFYDCYGLTSINIPEGVTSIGNDAFYGCSGLTSINIPASVTNIGKQAFKGCSGLTGIDVASGNSVYDSRNNCNAIIKTSDNILVSGCKNTVIPASVTYIGDYAFYGCSLDDIYCYTSTPTKTGYSMFYENTYSDCTLHVPYGTIDRYKTADGWRNCRICPDRR